MKQCNGIAKSFIDLSRGNPAFFVFIATELQTAGVFRELFFSTKGKTMSKRKIDPDQLRRDDPAYWAAALVLAIKSGNRANEKSARANLSRLGFVLQTVGDVAQKGGAQ